MEEDIDVLSGSDSESERDEISINTNHREMKEKIINTQRQGENFDKSSRQKREHYSKFPTTRQVQIIDTASAPMSHSRGGLDKIKLKFIDEANDFKFASENTDSTKLAAKTDVHYCRGSHESPLLPHTDERETDALMHKATNTLTRERSNDATVKPNPREPTRSNRNYASRAGDKRGPRSQMVLYGPETLNTADEENARFQSRGTPVPNDSDRRAGVSGSIQNNILVFEDNASQYYQYSSSDHINYVGSEFLQAHSARRWNTDVSNNKKNNTNNKSALVASEVKFDNQYYVTSLVAPEGFRQGVFHVCERLVDEANIDNNGSHQLNVDFKGRSNKHHRSHSRRQEATGNNFALVKKDKNADDDKCSGDNNGVDEFYHELARKQDSLERTTQGARGGENRERSRRREGKLHIDTYETINTDADIPLVRAQPNYLFKPIPTSFTPITVNRYWTDNHDVDEATATRDYNNISRTAANIDGNPSGQFSHNLTDQHNYSRSDLTLAEQLDRREAGLSECMPFPDKDIISGSIRGQNSIPYHGGVPDLSQPLSDNLDHDRDSRGESTGKLSHRVRNYETPRELHCLSAKRQIPTMFGRKSTSANTYQAPTKTKRPSRVELSRRRQSGKDELRERQEDASRFMYEDRNNYELRATALKQRPHQHKSDFSSKAMSVGRGIHKNISDDDEDDEDIIDDDNGESLLSYGGDEFDESENEIAEPTIDADGKPQYLLRNKSFRQKSNLISGEDWNYDLRRDLSEYDLDSFYAGGDAYVFYIHTDEGDVIGPMRFDVEDIQMGLPNGLSSNPEDGLISNAEEKGLRNRQTGSHGLNEFSSRSHSVLTVTIDSETQAEPEDENLYVTKRGKLSFVDLAGSEKVKDAASSHGGPGMLESNSINKSLLVLGNCISHLGDSKRRQGHIPYRDSKLTKLLADSLGGNGITLMIACITPSSSNTTETMNTLRYASRAKKIKTRPTVKMDPREKLIVALKKEIKVLRNENHYLRQQLDFPAKPKGQLQKENDEKFMKFMKETQQKESGLYEMLQEYMVENEALRAENTEMQSIKDNTRRDQQHLHRENERLCKRVEELERIISEHPNTWALLDNHRRTDGYGQYDLSPRGSPVTVGYHLNSGHKPAMRPTDLPAGGPGNRTKVGSPPHGQPKKPPHRLQDHVTRPAPRPVDFIEDGYPGNGYMSPRQSSLTSVKQGVASPRQVDRKASQVSQTDVIRANNEKLKKDLLHLEGEIHQHARIAQSSQGITKFMR